MSQPPFKLNGIAHSLVHVHDPAQPEHQPGERLLDVQGTPQEFDYLRRCMQRMRGTLRDAVGEAAAKFDEQTAAMDLMVVHRNCMPLDFFALLTSSDDDFTHDIFGVGMCIDRRSGQLTNGFMPRCRRLKS